MSDEQNSPIPTPEEYAAAREKLTVGWWYMCADGKWRRVDDGRCEAMLRGISPCPIILASAQPYDPRTRVGLGCCYRDGYGAIRGPMTEGPGADQPFRDQNSWSYTSNGRWVSGRVGGTRNDLDLTTAYWPTEQQAEEPVKTDDEPDWRARALAAEAELERVTRLHQEAETEAAELRDDDCNVWPEGFSVERSFGDKVSYSETLEITVPDHATISLRERRD